MRISQQEGEVKTGSQPTMVEVMKLGALGFMDTVAAAHAHHLARQTARWPAHISRIQDLPPRRRNAVSPQPAFPMPHIGNEVLKDPPLLLSSAYTASARVVARSLPAPSSASPPSDLAKHERVCSLQSRRAGSATKARLDCKFVGFDS